MRNSKRNVRIVLASAPLAAGLCACDRSGGTPGQELDRALDKTGEKIEEAGEAIRPR